MNKDKLLRNMFIALFLVATLAGLYQNENRAYNLIIKDRVVASVKSEEELLKAYEKVDDELELQGQGEFLNREYKLVPTFRKSSNILRGKELEKILLEEVPHYKNLWAVKKDGQVIAGLSSRDDALDAISSHLNSMIKAIKSDEVGNKAIVKDIIYINKIDVEFMPIDKELEMSKTNFLIKIISDTNKSLVTFRPNPPQFEGNSKPVEGFDNVYLTSFGPFSIDVIVVEERDEKIKLPQSTIMQYDETLEKGDELVKREGIDGELERKSENFLLNKQAIKSNVIEEKVIKEPQSEILVVGDRQEYLKPKFNWPVIGTITSGYGPRFDGFHRGLDIASYFGSSVKASQKGKVVFAGYQGSYGYVVYVDHKNGYQTRYAHLMKITTSEGSLVDEGDVIGLMGSSGNSTGSHVHFEILKDGETIDPEVELNAR